VSESAASYVSVLEAPPEFDGGDKDQLDEQHQNLPTAFSLPRFIPLLKERIWVINPFTRQFLVGWITLLDSIPDLELVTYLPDFLGGLLKFLGDQNADVRASIPLIAAASSLGWKRATSWTRKLPWTTMS
jgi:vacuole morphology and inheritance protein 14